VKLALDITAFLLHVGFRICALALVIRLTVFLVRAVAVIESRLTS
jgi:hypothetical protein